MKRKRRPSLYEEYRRMHKHARFPETTTATQLYEKVKSSLSTNDEKATPSLPELPNNFSPPKILKLKIHGEEVLCPKKTDKETHHQKFLYLYMQEALRRLSETGICTYKVKDTDKQHLTFPYAKIDLSFILRCEEEYEEEESDSKAFWGEIVFVAEIKSNLELESKQKEVTGQLVSRFSTIFSSQRNRQICFGLAMSARLFFIVKAVRRKNGETVYYQTNMYKTKTKKAKNLLMRFLSTKPEDLGFVLPELDARQLGNLNFVSKPRVLYSSHRTRIYQIRYKEKRNKPKKARQRIAKKTGVGVLKITTCKERWRQEVDILNIFLQEPISGVPRILYSSEERLELATSPLGVKLSREYGPEETLTLIQQAREILEKIHTEYDIVHCDIKPDNLITQELKGVRKVYILDWDTAKQGEAKESSKWTGTPAYASISVLTQYAEAVERMEKSCTFVYTPKDDIESLFYTLLRLISGRKLPWERFYSVVEILGRKEANIVKNWDTFLAELQDSVEGDWKREEKLWDYVEALHLELFQPTGMGDATMTEDVPEINNKDARGRERGDCKECGDDCGGYVKSANSSDCDICGCKAAKHTPLS